jgi:hypothetical protein
MGFVTNVLNLNEFIKFNFIKPYQIDFADKLNWQMTMNLLALCVIVISNTRSIVNKVISCAVPIYFPSNHEEYANEICYISEKYMVNESERIIINGNSTNQVELSYLNKSISSPRVISYYVWVPYILIAQIFMLFIPERVWSHLMYNLTEIDVKELLKAVKLCNNLLKQSFSRTDFQSRKRKSSHQKNVLQRNNNFKFVLFQIRHYLAKINLNHLNVDARSITINNNRSLRFKSNRLFLAYLLIKLCCILNIFLQIFLINKLVGLNMFEIGLYPMIRYVSHLKRQLDSQVKNSFFVSNVESHRQENNIYFSNSEYFPLKSLCTFRVRELTTIHTYAITCTLPINLFIQYVFFVLSIWYFFILLINLSYFVKWSIFFIKYGQTGYLRNKFKLKVKQFLKKQQELNGNSSHNQNQLVEETFYCSFLTKDFLFLLEIIAINTNNNELLINQIINHFWQFYYVNYFIK